jgi:hypothetical protein
LDYVKLWTTVHDDPDLRRLSDRAFRWYIYAWSWCGKHETDGVYDVMAGLVPAKALEELAQRGKLIPVDDEHYAIRGWGKRQVSVDDLERRRAAGKAAADARWNATRNAIRIPKRSRSPNAEEQVKEQEEEQETSSPEKPARARDALFDALATATDRDPTGMTRREQRACGTALADIRRATPTLTPAELQRRAAHYRAHFPQAALTPSALANQWSACDRPPMSAAKETRAERLAKEIVG